MDKAVEIRAVAQHCGRAAELPARPTLRFLDLRLGR